MFDLQIILIVLLVATLLVALLAVLARTLPVATVLLALTSALIAIILYLVGMKLAAVIELSVSVGLVTAILASAIALLKPRDDESQSQPSLKARLLDWLLLPLIMVLVAVAIVLLAPGADIQAALDQPLEFTAATVLWSKRALDIIGLALLLLAGVLGVVAMIQRRKA